MGWDLWNMVATLGAFMLAASILVFLINVVKSVKTGDVDANVPKYQEASVTVYNAEHARVCATKLTGSDARMTPASNFPSRAYLQCETDADCISHETPVRISDD